MTDLDTARSRACCAAISRTLPSPALDLAAARAGLLDVAYATVDSPVGPLLLAMTERGLVRLAYLGEGDRDRCWRSWPRECLRGCWTHRASSTSHDASSISTSPGPGKTSSSRSTGPLSHGFGLRVLRATARIPFGSVSTYKDVAAASGQPARVSRRRQRPRRQPAADRGALPSGPACRRRSRRLHRRPGPQAAAARTGRCCGGGRSRLASPTVRNHDSWKDLPPGPRLPAPVQLLATWTRPAGALKRCVGATASGSTVRLPGQPPFVIVSDAEDIKELFTAPPEIAHPGEGAAILEPILGRNSVILLDEAAHMEQRKLLLPAFHGEKMQALTGVMQSWRSARSSPGRSASRSRSIRGCGASRSRSSCAPYSGLISGPRLDGLRGPVTRVLEFSETRCRSSPPPGESATHAAAISAFDTADGEIDALIFELIEERRRRRPTTPAATTFWHAARGAARGCLADVRPGDSRRTDDRPGGGPRDHRLPAGLGVRASRPRAARGRGADRGARRRRRAST